jgi:hypothetical protein
MDWEQLGQDILGNTPDVNVDGPIALSASGNRMAIGTLTDTINGADSGSLRVFELDGCIWKQLGDSITGETGERFGTGVALSADGNRVSASSVYANGFAGFVKTFDWDGNNWIQVGQTITGELDSQTGWSVSLSDDGFIMAVSSIRDLSSAGYVTIYALVGTIWIQIGQRLEGVVGELFGFVVSISSDGTRLAIGVPFFSLASPPSANIGMAKIYERINGIWVQIGSDIIGESAGDVSARRVSLSGNGARVAIGAHGNSDGGNGAGHARVYEYNESASPPDWEQLGDDIDGEVAGDSASNVALSNDGSRLVVGAPGNDGNDISNTNKGRVRVYEWDDVTSPPVWVQLGSNIDGTGSVSTTGLGFLVAINSNGSRVAATAPNSIVVSDSYARAFEFMPTQSLTKKEATETLVYWQDVISGLC